MKTWTLARRVGESDRLYKAREQQRRLRERITAPPIPLESDWNRGTIYVEALRRLAKREGGPWITRYEAMENNRLGKRWMWLAWVERQAAAPKGQQWCKQLVTEAVTIKLGQ